MRSPFIPWAREEKERKRDRRSIVGVPSSKALPGFRITAHPCVYVPAAFGVLACWFQTKKKSGRYLVAEMQLVLGLHKSRDASQPVKL